MRTSLCITVGLSSVLSLVGATPLSAQITHYGGLVNGYPVDQASMPEFVQVAKNGPQGELLHHCGGTIIAKEWVLTAAHCVADVLGSVKARKNLVEPAERFTLVHPASGERRAVTEVLVPHALFIRGWNADLALVHAQTAFSTDARAALAGAFSARPHTGTADSWGKGWVQEGSTHTESPTVAIDAPAFQRQTLELRPVDACVGNPKSVNRMLCAGFKVPHVRAPKACGGSSGAPLTILSDDPAQRVQIGVMSQKFFAPGELPCGYHPTLYTNVADWSVWIAAMLPDQVKFVTYIQDEHGFEHWKPTPTPDPSAAPSTSPSGQPKPDPSVDPSPSAQPDPSVQPKPQPSVQPTNAPTAPPSRDPKPAPPGGSGPVNPGQPSAAPRPQPPAAPTPAPQPSTPPSAQPSTGPGVPIDPASPADPMLTPAELAACGPVTAAESAVPNGDSPQLAWQPPRGAGAGSAVSVAASRLAWPKAGEASHVFLANECAWADALVATSQLDKGPLLFTQREVLEAEVKAEITRLGVTSVTLVGGPKAISPEVEKALTAMGLTVTRVSGETRLGTAQAVAGLFSGKPVHEVMMARAYPQADGTPSQAFADSMGAAYRAPLAHAPVVLTHTDQVAQPTAAGLRALAPKTITLLGGPLAISPGVEREVKGRLPKADIARVAGVTRADTAAQLARKHLDDTKSPVKGVLVIDGQDEDAWKVGYALASLAVKTKSVYALAAGDTLAPETQALIKDAKAKGLPVRCVAAAKACAQATALTP